MLHNLRKLTFWSWWKILFCLLKVSKFITIFFFLFKCCLKIRKTIIFRLIKGTEPVIFFDILVLVRFKNIWERINFLVLNLILVPFKNWLIKFLTLGKIFGLSKNWGIIIFLIQRWLIDHLTEAHRLNIVWLILFPYLTNLRLLYLIILWNKLF